MRTHERVLEIMPKAVSKASALTVVAETLGINPSKTIVFGDGDNDVPMFEWAGASVAMAHGWPSALQTATYTTTEGPLATALARGVDLAFARGYSTVSVLNAPPPPRDAGEAPRSRHQATISNAARHSLYPATHGASERRIPHGREQQVLVA